MADNQSENQFSPPDSELSHSQKPVTTDTHSRSQIWVWWVCCLLLLASTINYMDRQTLANVSLRITDEFNLSETQYGNLELAFGLAFAGGALLFGAIADSVDVRILYPVVLVLWSAMGFVTGYADTYYDLLTCRLLLGLFEAGHWPCALKTTQKLLPRDRRTLGNSVLQSGTAIGAIVVPRIMKLMLTSERGSWRPVFQWIGAIGVVWVVLWLITIFNGRWESQSDANIETDPENLESKKGRDDEPADATFVEALLSRKFLALLIVVVGINSCWHFFRVWLPKFLVKGRGYEEGAMFEINFWFNILTDVGCLSAGFLTAWLCRNGFSVHASRFTVFSLCSVLVGLGCSVPFLGRGPILLAVLFVVGAGALGLFPCYYSLSQELSKTHQGKITGLLGTFAWVTSAPLHPLFGSYVDLHKSYDLGMAIASACPLVAAFALFVVWPREAPSKPVESTG